LLGPPGRHGDAIAFLAEHLCDRKSDAAGGPSDDRCAVWHLQSLLSDDTVEPRAGRGKAVGSIPHFTGTVWPGPRLKSTPRRGRARSSVGQSCRLIIGRSLVRVQPGPHQKAPLMRGFLIFVSGPRIGGGPCRRASSATNSEAAPTPRPHPRPFPRCRRLARPSLR